MSIEKQLQNEVNKLAVFTESHGKPVEYYCIACRKTPKTVFAEMCFEFNHGEHVSG